MYTAQDVMYYLLTTVGGGSQDLEQRILRSSINNAFRDVVHSRDWLWHTTSTSITTVASATMPIPPQPPGPVATQYLLPEDCKNIDGLFTPYPDGTPEGRFFWKYLSPTDYNRFIENRTSTYPDSYYTVMSAAPDAPGRYKLCISEQLRDGTVMQFTYRRKPKPLSLFGSEPFSRTGTISNIANVFSGNGTDFQKRMIGSVLRTGSDSSHVPEPVDGIYPYSWQSIITDVSDNGSGEVVVTTSDTPPEDVSGVRYCVSNYLDCSDGMYTAILSYAELWYARLSGKPIDAPAAVASRDLRQAFETDQMAPIAGRRMTTAYPDWANNSAFPTRV